MQFRIYLNVHSVISSLNWLLKFGDGGIFWIITSAILVFPKKTRALFRKENGLAKIVWIPVTVLSVLIMFSRLYLYVHFPTDVLCGALLGIIFGTAGYLVYRKISSRRVKEE